MRHLLINALPVGSGGNVTVVRELTRHLLRARPDWHLTLLLTKDKPAHQHIAQGLPSSGAQLTLHHAPPETARRMDRFRFERRALPSLVRDQKIDRVLQVNGQVIPGLERLTFSHFGDPWPYLPEARSGWKEHVLAMLRRREQGRGLRRAAACGFTSAWMKQLVTSHHHVTPRVAEVLHNGVPAEWVHRARAGFPSWQDRPSEILTVGHVAPYKGQQHVIAAMPAILKAVPEARYRVIGQLWEPFQSQLLQLADTLGVADRVTLEGSLSDAAVMEAYARARVFVLPSLCESFGIPLIEAMSFGTPVIAANRAALPEVLGHAGLLAEPEPASIATAAIRLLQGEDVDALRLAGLANMERFNWSDTADKLARLLEKM